MNTIIFRFFNIGIKPFRKTPAGKVGSCSVSHARTPFFHLSGVKIGAVGKIKDLLFLIHIFQIPEVSPASGEELYFFGREGQILRLDPHEPALVPIGRLDGDCTSATVAEGVLYESDEQSFYRRPIDGGAPEKLFENANLTGPSLSRGVHKFSIEINFQTGEEE